MNRAIREAVRHVAVAYLTVLAGLGMFTFLPQVVGYRAAAVSSGSMAPALDRGDIVLYERAPARRGDIVLADRPASTSGPGTVSHRVVEVHDDRSLTTKGDANTTVDSDPVAPGQVRGVVRMVVPAVGLPAVWLGEGASAPVLAWLLVTALAGWSAMSAGRARRSWRLRARWLPLAGSSQKFGDRAT